MYCAYTLSQHKSVHDVTDYNLANRNPLVYMYVSLPHKHIHVCVTCTLFVCLHISCSGMGIDKQGIDPHLLSGPLVTS